MANNNWYLIEPNYDSSDFVEDIIEKGEVADPKIATVYGTEEDKFQHNIQYRDCYTSFIIDPDIMDQLLKYFGPVLKKLKYNISHLESLQYTVYDEGHYYNWHQDNHPAPYEDGTIRKLSMTMFLTDPDEYEGGELEIDSGEADNTALYVGGYKVFEVDVEKTIVEDTSDPVSADQIKEQDAKLLHNYNPNEHGIGSTIQVGRISSDFKVTGVTLEGDLDFGSDDDSF